MILMDKKFSHLRGFERTEEEKKEALRENKALLLILYLDTKCNMNCSFCFLDSGKSAKNRISLKDYKMAIRQAKALGVRSVVFAGAGEPLLDKKLFPLMEYSNKLGLYCVLITNASLVTEKIAKRMYGMDVSVIASIKSLNPKSLEKLTRVKGSAERIYEGFNNLLSAGFNKSEPTRLGVNVLVCKEIYGEVPDLVRFCVKNNIFVMLESLLWKGRAAENLKQLEISDRKKEALYNKLLEEFPRLGKERSFLDAPKCDIDHYAIFVNYNGDVWPCFSRDFVMGNVKKENLEEIWNNPQLRAFRERPVVDCGICPGRKYYRGFCLRSKAK